jgi:hypothetical protein
MDEKKTTLFCYEVYLTTKIILVGPKIIFLVFKNHIFQKSQFTHIGQL